MRLLLTAIGVMIAVLWAGAEQVVVLSPLSTEGRFLYANDDDWDWASPLGAKEPSRLATAYGKMPWSALDWMEEGLAEVRGVLVGTPPVVGNYLTMADLNKLRGAGPKVSYKQIDHKQDTLADLFRAKMPPNVVIIMQDVQTSGPPPVSTADADAALEFVARGGRLLVLDDWTYYRALVTPFLDVKKFPPSKVAPASGIDEMKILDLIKLLDHDQFAVREKATVQLMQLGPKIVPELEAFGPKTPEQEIRINKLLKHFKPAPPTSPDGDAWMRETAAKACQLHKLCELKLISRNGNMEPGSALCLRLPVTKK
jgi:hypothetical protein